MNKLNIELENCYGIKKLTHKFDYSQQSAYIIYAPNGSMKSSLARTFKDISDESYPRDRIHPDRKTISNITDENGIDLSKEEVLAIRPYEDGDISHSVKTSTLLVDSKLRKEYEDLFEEIEKLKESFLKGLKSQSGSKKDLEKEISSAFMKSEDEFFYALIRVQDEVVAQKDTPFENVKYDTIFDEKVLKIFESSDVKKALENYIKKYNELLDASTYFKKGVFNYYNAATIAKILENNGFFDAKHSVNLNADESLEIITCEQLEELIQKEKDSITNDKELRKIYTNVEKLIQKNESVRGFEKYLGEHEEILPELANIEAFKEKIWKSYFKVRFESYKNLIQAYQDAKQRKEEIESEALKQRTQWEEVIDIFNSRFFVPFELSAENRTAVILGQEPMLKLSYTFVEGTEKTPITRDSLMETLSTGEKRAFYMLNIIFEVEARKKANQETVFVIDDIADSFDYMNKYAIIQYLKDISVEANFKQIILTHNFDFYRTVQSRFVPYKYCLMALKNDDGVSLEQAKGIRNPFVNDWKGHFYDDPKKKIASIPFMRNLKEYTLGDKDSDFIKLTSLLHWKEDSDSITLSDLDAIYNSMFSDVGSSSNGGAKVVDMIIEEANDCLNITSSIDLENKIVLSIAIRLIAEKYMVMSIKNPSFVDNISSNQTTQLFERFKELSNNGTAVLGILQRVILMTPDNIHLNSFMYEPIIDMSDDHLKQLYRDVTSLS